MKYYIIQRTPFPEGSAGTQRVKCYAKALSKFCDVTVLVSCQSNKYDIPLDGVYDGIKYKFITPLRTTSNKPVIHSLQLIYQEISLIIYLLFNLHKNDVVFSYFLSVYYGPWDMFVTHLKGAKFVAELCELPYGTSCETSKHIKKRKKVLEDIYPKIDGVIAISDALKQLALRHVRKNVPVLKIPILVDYKKYDIEDLSEQADIPYIFHAGSLLQQKDGILGMLKAYYIARKDLCRPLKFICTGSIENSRDHKEISNLIHKYSMENDVVFTGYLTEVEVRHFLQRASLVIINKSDNQQNTYCFSTKLGEYMAAGKSIIITRVGEPMNWLTNQKDCLIIEPDDTFALADAIKTLINDNSLRKKLGNNAKLTCKDCFGLQNWGNKIFEYLKSL